MRVLLDESVPRQLAPLLEGHSVSTVPREGWAGVTNGELLRLASQGFDALVTGDRNLEYQQNLAASSLGIIVLVAPDNRVETITGMAPRVLDALSRLGAGHLIRVSA